tara:strand:+ start:728 stop:1246 length:519 start_codon:yes stop_codon:yes gene_type:complete
MDSETPQPKTTQTPLPEDLESIILSIKNGNHEVKDLETLSKHISVQLLSNMLEQEIEQEEATRTQSTYGSKPLEFPELGTYYYTQDFHPQPKHPITTIKEQIKFKLLENCGGVLIIHPNNDENNQDQNQIYTNCLVFSTGHWVSIQYFNPVLSIYLFDKEPFQIEENRITFL